MQAAAPKTRDFARVVRSERDVATAPIRADKEHSSVWRRMKIPMAFGRMGGGS